MTTLPTTMLFAGVLALMQVTLSVVVSVGRARTGIDLLDGGNPGLLRRIRAHGNFIETVPLVLVAMALLEAGGAPDRWLTAGGAALIVGRVLHASSLLTNNANWSRRGGMLLTLLVMASFGIACIAIQA